MTKKKLFLILLLVLSSNVYADDDDEDVHEAENKLTKALPVKKITPTPKGSKETGGGKGVFADALKAKKKDAQKLQELIDEEE